MRSSAPTTASRGSRGPRIRTAEPLTRDPPASWRRLRPPQIPLEDPPPGATVPDPTEPAEPGDAAPGIDALPEPVVQRAARVPRGDVDRDRWSHRPGRLRIPGTIRPVLEFEIDRVFHRDRLGLSSTAPRVDAGVPDPP